MIYTLKFHSHVLKDFKKINKSDILFIQNSLEEFRKNFNPSYEKTLLKTQKIKKLKTEYKNIYRLRLRTYRVIYQKNNNELLILILNIKSRSNSYKNL